MSYTNTDGLYVKTNGDEGTVRYRGVTTEGPTRFLVYKLTDASLLTDTTVSITPDSPYIPAGSYIKSATFVTKDDFTSGGSATLDIGLYNSAGTAIVADGIDADIALSALDPGDVVKCDGSLSNGTLTVGSANAYVAATYETAAFTAGSGTLFIEYIPPYL